MQPHSMEARRAFYAGSEPGAKWPDSVPWVGGDGRLYAMWLLGQDYRGTGYHGSYPPNYLARVQALFPDAERVLHLFSGSLPAGPYVRFDLRDVECDVRGDAHELSRHFAPGSFDLILADPPYTAEDADRYGTPWISRNKVVKQTYIVLEHGGYLVWLDQVLPMFRKAEFEMAGCIGMVRSTNHRFRVCTIFRHTTPTSWCSVCGGPQFETPGGKCCRNGHGGAAGLEAPSKPVDPALDGFV